MKKTLLCILASASAIAATADYKDYFFATDKGAEIANGATVTCTEYTPNVYEDWANQVGGEPTKVNVIDFEIVLNMTNPTNEDQFAIGGLYYVIPDEAGFHTQNPFGSATFCSGTNCYPPLESLAGNCGFTDGVKVAPGSGFTWNIHLLNASENFTNAKFEVKLSAGQKEYDPNGYYDDEDGNGPYDIIEVDGTEYSFFITFSKDGAAVDGITAEDAETEYFNLQGLRVANPEQGLYIVKQGNKVTKEIIRK